MIAATNLTTLGKYLDQPAVVNKIAKSVTPLLVSSATLYGLYDTYKAPTEQRKKSFIKNLCVISFTLASAILATKGLKIGNKQIFKGLIHGEGHHHHHVEKTLHSIGSKATEAVKHCCHGHSHDEINHLLESVGKSNLFDQPVKDKLAALIKKAGHKEYLNIKEVRFLSDKLKQLNPQKKLMDLLIPLPHSHGPLAEIKDLSLLGLIPVMGGIAGGELGDRIVGEKSRQKTANRLKEGFYQYAANIVLCNVGAGVALITMDKLGVKSRLTKSLGMIAGIVSVGVLGGNVIANYIGEKFFNPLIDQGFKGLKRNKSGEKPQNSDRKPEFLDVCLHVDDFASVGFLSGLKWIGPILPAIYSVSGYRAGIGYRNVHNHKHADNKHQEGFKGAKYAVSLSADNRFSDYTSKCVFKPFEERMKTNQISLINSIN